ncbi:MAG: ATP-binding protein, partial [Myxococcota bacterium]
MEDFQTWQTINALASCGEFGAWAWALPGERLSVSEGYYTQLGHPEGAWSPSYEAFARLVHSEDIGDADRAVQAVLSGASDRIEAEVRVRDAEGAWRWVQVRARVTARDRYGAPVEILGLHRNVHEAKMQGHALLAARKMEVLGQLTGGMAHDFNNLVTIFAMNVDLLDGSDPEGLIECREALERAVERSRGFTRSLLSYCRTPAEPGVREHDAVEVAQNLAPMLSSALGDRARLELDLGVRGPCLVDASALENALLNLVLNARDAMLDGPGTVIIRVAEEGERLYLSVVDDGVGMTEEVRSRALEPLFTTKQENEGTGLGLAMVDRHVAAWGGELRLQSELGVGTRVDIILPKVSVREEVEASASNDQPVSPGSVLAPRRILLVDDEGLVAQVTARVLR